MILKLIDDGLIEKNRLCHFLTESKSADMNVKTVEFYEDILKLICAE